MRAKKFFKVAAITLLAVALLLFASIAVFVFNPLEGSLRDMRDIVPRDVDFFLRKLDLDEDFVEAPEPHFWGDLAGHPGWYEKVVRGPTYRDLNGRGEITAALDEVRAQLASVRAQSGGFFDIVEHVIGNELEIAGKLGDATGGGAAWCAYARVAWQAKAALGALRYGFAQERVRQGGLEVSYEAPMFVLQAQGGPPLYAARYLDCVIAGNDRELVQRSYGIATGEADAESFGASASYRDGVERRLREWEEQTDQAANAIEFYLRPDRYFGLPSITWDDRWPDPHHPTDMNERVLASFFNLSSWLYLTGALIFEPDSLSLLADIELDRNKHTAFQGNFFQTERQSNRKWLRPFMSMVPANACAFAAMRMPAGDFMREMFGALTETERTEIDELLRRTDDFESMNSLIDTMALALSPRTGFVFRANEVDRATAEMIAVADPAPVPQVAWVFWMESGREGVLTELVEKITNNFQLLGFTTAYDLPLGVGGSIGKDAAREFLNPQIPGTGSIATLVYPPFFVLSNSGPLIRDMMQARLLSAAPSILGNPDLDEYLRDVPDAVNGLVFLQSNEIERVLQGYDRDIVQSGGMPDPEWAQQRRSTAQLSVFRQKYSRHGSMAGIPESERAAFERDVDAELDDMWRRERTNYSADARASIAEAIGLTRLFRSAYLQLTLEPRHLQLSGRALAAFR